MRYLLSRSHAVRYSVLCCLTANFFGGGGGVVEGLEWNQTEVYNP